MHCPFLPHNHSCKLQASKNYYPATLSWDGHLAHTALSGSSWFVETWANVHYQPYSVKKTYLLPLVKLRKLQVAVWPSEKDMTRIPCNVTQLYNLGHPPGCNCKLILMNRTWWRVWTQKSIWFSPNTPAVRNRECMSIHSVHIIPNSMISYKILLLSTNPASPATVPFLKNTD